MPDHEHTDASPGGIALAGVGFVIFMIATMITAFLLFRFLAATDHRAEQIARREPGAGSKAVGGPRFDGPLLQTKPEMDLAAMQTEFARDLGEFRWEDRAAGAVRIPIDLAMKLLVERGMPAYPSATLVEIQQQRQNPEPGHQLVPPKP